jgi:hypothetical protein
MAVMTPARTTNGCWLSRARHGLIYLCCLLTLTVGAPEAGLWAFSAPHPPLETGEGEERPGNDENEDGKDNEQGKRGGEDFARHSRSRRLACGGDPANVWLAHLPHHHGAVPGYSLPVCSPFERGALLPLRC